MSSDMDPSGESYQEPANLRFLRRLVTALTATMIVGLLVLIGLFVIRFSAAATPPLPEEITLPAGVEALSVTHGPGWYLVVGQNSRIYVYDRDSGALIQETELKTP